MSNIPTDNPIAQKLIDALEANINAQAMNDDAYNDAVDKIEMLPLSDKQVNKPIEINYLHIEQHEANS